MPAKLVYSLFLLFILLGLWSSALIYGDRIGSRNTSPPGQPSVQERYVQRAPVAKQGGPSLDLGEATDKGSINQRAVLGRRAALVEELYAKPYSARVISIEGST